MSRKSNPSKKFKPNTHYNDIQGEIAIDNSDTKDMLHFIKDNGIDTNIYYPVGIKYCRYIDIETFIIYTINKDELGSKSVIEYIDSKKVIPVKTFEVQMKLEDYIKNYTKNFSMAISNVGLIKKKTKEQRQ
ncbi:hypothetical protein ACNSOL_01530 [Aliarcobacter lanthieri]|uniref:hypothetical protein n=1 Tax=Aliarcobacter lanthieri TaxID=1355374 RepID=UPI003AAACF4C